MVYGFNRWFWWNRLELWYRVATDALAHPDAQHATAARSRALYIASSISYLTGRYADAFALAETSVAIARECGDSQALSEALFNLGIAALAIERVDGARENFEEGLALARKAGDTTAIAMALTGLGELHAQQDRHALAEAAYLEALDNSRDPESALIAMGNLARSAIALRAEARAVRYLREGMAKSGPHRSPMVTQMALWNGAGIAALRGEWARALRTSGAADGHGDRSGLQGLAIDARIHASHMAPARAALGNEAAAANFAAGRALDSDAALAEVAAWLATLPGDPAPT